MRTPQQLFDGLGFAANTAWGLGRGLCDEVKNLVESRIAQKLAGMDLVTRAEYDELRAMVAEMRLKQEIEGSDKSLSKAEDKNEDT